MSAHPNRTAHARKRPAPVRTPRCWAHAAAIVDAGSRIGAGTRVWAFSHVMAGAVVGRHCNLGEHVFVENGAVIGNRVTIKNGVQVWDGVRIADDVFVGPNVTLTNDRYPRSPRSRAAGNRYETKRWRQRTAIGQGAAIGANATIVSGVRIGRYAVVGAGAVVTKSVPPFAVVIGVPARPHGQACLCGRPLPSPASAGVVRCGGCGRAYRVRGGTLHPTRTTGRSGSGP